MIHNAKDGRRDWTMLIFLIPIGFLLIVIVGQAAVRLSPFWRVNADMNSNIETDPNAARPFALLEPILPQILTPVGWMDNYLTPGADYSFPPFLTLSPTASPAPTEATPTPAASSPTPSPAATGTPPPTATNTVVATATPPPPTETDDPPPDDTSAPTCNESNASNYGGALPCRYPVTSTPDPGYTFDNTPPSQINVGGPPDNIGSGSGNVGHITDGTYVVLALTVTVGATPDNNYDLAFYEWNNSGTVYFDWIIIGISDNGGATYYEVFNWGDGTPDANSNVGDFAAVNGEDDNEPILVNPPPPLEPELYDPDETPPPDGPRPQTGILIDVDRATSNPMPGDYNYVVLISPSGGSGESAQVDAVQAVEVPTPTPTPPP